MATTVSGKARQARNSTTLQTLARVGLIAYGMVHLLVGGLALQIAWGGSSSKGADHSGALKALAEQPFGKVLLWLVAAGMVGLAVWQASQAGWGYRDRTGARRLRKQVTSGGKSVVYATLGVSAASAALGSASSSSHHEQEATSGVLAWPGGQAIVVAAALVVVGVGVAHVVKALRESFREEIDASSLSAPARRGMVRLGQTGYIARGVAMGVFGGLLGYAAWTFDPGKARGLDGALHTILAQPYGRLLLTAVALGFMAFGLFAILQSRYRRM